MSGGGRGAEREGFAALFGGIGFASGLIECGGEGGMRGGVGGVGGDGAFELDEGFGDLAPLEEQGSAVDAEVSFLTADGDAGEIGGDLAFAGGFVLPAFRGEDGGERDVGAGLRRQEGDGVLEGRGGFYRLPLLAVDAAECGPGVAVAGAEGNSLLEAGGGFR